MESTSIQNYCTNFTSAHFWVREPYSLNIQLAIIGDTLVGSFLRFFKKYLLFRLRLVFEVFKKVFTVMVKVRF